MTWTPPASLLGFATAVSLSLAGCADTRYGGAACEALTPGMVVDALPLLSVGPLPENAWQLADPFIDGTGEVACCAGNSYFTPAAPVDCATVDCEALRQRLTRSRLGGVYDLEPCGPRQGAGVCWAYLDGDRLAGVQAFCFD